MIDLLMIIALGVVLIAPHFDRRLIVAPTTDHDPGDEDRT